MPSFRTGRVVRLLEAMHERGIGIAQKDLQKIFEPYFSTKDAGLGLGLALPYLLVAAFPALAARLCSTWTVTLQVHALRTLARAGLRLLGAFGTAAWAALRAGADLSSAR